MTRWFAKRTTDQDGVHHASAKEAARANELMLLVAAKEITHFEQQPRVELLPGVFFKADFKYREKHPGFGWLTIYEDSKGVETDRFRMICKLWKIAMPATCILRVTKQGRRGGVAVKEIVPLGPTSAISALRGFWKRRAL